MRASDKECQNIKIESEEGDVRQAAEAAGGDARKETAVGFLVDAQLLEDGITKLWLRKVCVYNRVPM